MELSTYMYVGLPWSGQHLRWPHFTCSGTIRRTGLQHSRSRWEQAENFHDANTITTWHQNHRYVAKGSKDYWWLFRITSHRANVAWHNNCHWVSGRSIRITWHHAYIDLLTVIAHAQ